MIGPLIVLILAALILLGVPVAFALGIAGAVGLLMLGISQPIEIPQQIYGGLQSFPLVAIPMFLLMANLMDRAGITISLVRLSQAAVGRIRGSLAIGTVGASMFMGGISGSALADTTSIGALMIPAMKEEKYPAPFASALTSAANIVGPIVPPSILMILYGLGTGQSVITLFVAGVVPGVLISIAFGILAYVLVRRHNYGQAPDDLKFSFRRLGDSALRASPAVVIPVVILAGVLKGVFTITESAGVAAAYALGYLFVRAAVRRIPLRTVLNDAWLALRKTYEDTAVVAFLIGGSALLAIALTLSGLSDQMVQGIAGLHLSSGMLVVALIIAMAVMGTMLEPAASILLVAALFVPLVKDAHINLVQFGLIAVVTLQIGTLTPPVGTSAYITARIARISYEQVIIALLPWLVIAYILLATIAAVPQITLWLPTVFHLT